MTARIPRQARAALLCALALANGACGTPEPSRTLQVPVATPGVTGTPSLPATTAPEPTPTCPSVPAATAAAPTAKNMASVYDTIVVGTVRSLGQPRRYDTPYVQIVLTPAVAEVERALHGNIGEGNLHVEVSTFDGACPRVYYVEAPSVEAGGRYVLFIYRSGSNVRGLSDVPIVTAAWPIDADDVITTAIDGPMTLKAFIALLPKPRTSPSGGPATPP